MTSERETADLHRRAAALEWWETELRVARDRHLPVELSVIETTIEVLRAALSARETPEPSALEQRLRPLLEDIKFSVAEGGYEVDEASRNAYLFLKEHGQVILALTQAKADADGQCVTLDRERAEAYAARQRLAVPEGARKGLIEDWTDLANECERHDPKLTTENWISWAADVARRTIAVLATPTEQAKGSRE